MRAVCTSEFFRKSNHSQHVIRSGCDMHTVPPRINEYLPYSNQAINKHHTHSMYALVRTAFTECLHAKVHRSHAPYPAHTNTLSLADKRCIPQHWSISTHQQKSHRITSQHTSLLTRLRTITDLFDLQINTTPHALPEGAPSSYVLECHGSGSSDGEQKSWFFCWSSEEERQTWLQHLEGVRQRAYVRDVLYVVFVCGVVRRSATLLKVGMLFFKLSCSPFLFFFVCRCTRESYHESSKTATTICSRCRSN